METPGEYLSRERELRGVSVGDISLALKMSQRLVKALEHDDYESLPHPTYVKGFVRAYAVYLGIDEDDAVLRYEAYQSDRRLEAEKIKALTADITKDEYVDSPRHVKSWSSGGFNIAGLLGKGRRGNSRGNNKTGVIFVAAGILIVILYFVFAGGVDKPSQQIVKASADEINKTINIEEPADKALQVSKEDSKVKARTVKAKPKAKAPVKAVKVKVKVKDKALPQKAATVPPVKESLKKTPVDREKKLLLEVVASDTTWMGIEIDGQEQREALLQPGETARWKATKVFF